MKVNRFDTRCIQKSCNKYGWDTYICAQQLEFHILWTRCYKETVGTEKRYVHIYLLFCVHTYIQYTGYSIIFLRVLFWTQNLYETHPSYSLKSQLRNTIQIRMEKQTSTTHELSGCTPALAPPSFYNQTTQRSRTSNFHYAIFNQAIGIRKY